MPTSLALDAATRLRRYALPVLAAMTLALTAIQTQIEARLAKGDR